MIVRMGIILVVGFIFFYLCPSISLRLIGFQHKRILSRLAERTPISGIVHTYRASRLVIQRNTGKDSESDAEPLEIIPGHTSFFMVSDDSHLIPVEWRSIFLVQAGTQVHVYESKSRWQKNICIFFNEHIPEPLEFSSLESAQNPYKKWFIATGSFLEFLILLESSGHPELLSTTIAALIALFGRALPWCPPGIVCTLAGQHLQRTALKNKTDTGMAKKNRHQKAAGFLLILAGVILNIGCIFFIIHVTRVIQP